MSIDTIGDCLTIIRNGIMRAKPWVLVPYSELKRSILDVMKNEGFIRDVAVESGEGPKKYLKVYLKYVNGESVIHEVKRVSSPGWRRYGQVRSNGSHTVSPVIGGLGISILSTNRGILTNKKAKELGVGGEIICTVW